MAKKGLRILFRRIQLRRSSSGCVGGVCGTPLNDVHEDTTLSALIN